MVLRKKHFGLLTALVATLFCAFSLKAQVTIGEQKAPESFSILELISSNGDSGLRLPQLTSDERDDLIPDLTGNDAANGLIIYNTDIDCVEFWNGAKWVSFCVSTLNLSQDYPQAISICLDRTHTFTLEEATGATDITYQWQESSDNINWSNAPGASTNANYTTPALSSNMYYRRMAIAENGSVASASALVTVVNGPCLANSFAPVTTKYVDFIVGVDAAGDGSTTPTDTRTLRFMTYNLGADPNMTLKEQMAYPGCPEDMTVYGGWYQWGRADHEHTFRCDIPNTNTNYFMNTQVAAESASNGKFIYGFQNWNSSGTNNLWGNGSTIAGGGNDPVDNKGDYDPCPAGWRVPTLQEWGLLINETSALYDGVGNNVDFSSSATLLRGDTYWVRVVNGRAAGDFAAGDMGGYALYSQSEWDKVGADAYRNGTADLFAAGAPEPLMFLPAAGRRHYSNGTVYGMDEGVYWSSCINGANALRIAFNSSSVNADANNVRAFGFSVRCIAE